MSKLKQLIAEAIQSLLLVEEEAEKLEPVITEPTTEPEGPKTVEEINVKVYIPYTDGVVHFKDEASLKELIFITLRSKQITHSENGIFDLFNIINEFNEKTALYPTYQDGYKVYLFEFRILPRKDAPIEEDPAIEMIFKEGDLIVNDNDNNIERIILEVHNGYYIWKYDYDETKSWDSRNSSDPELVYWSLKTPRFKGVQLSVEDDGKDKTEYFREQFKDSHAIYKLPKGKFWAEGVLATDKKVGFWEVQNGEHGIIRIDGLNNVVIDASETILFQKEAAVWDGDLDGDGLTDIMPETGRKYPADYSTMSQRKFVRIMPGSKYIHIDGLTGESFNSKSFNKPGLPDYDSRREFEHLIDARDSQYIALTNLTGRFLGGDGIYINGCDDVFVKNNLIHWNGRQGEAMIAGNRGYFEKQVIANSRRGGLDIEGNVLGDDTQDFVITFSYYGTHLVGLPMGGEGLVKNVLSINNHYGGTPVWSKGNGDTRLRKNIMIVGNKQSSLGRYLYTHNILLDGLVQDGMYNDELEIGKFVNCKNVHIRNIDMPSYGRLGRAEEPFCTVSAFRTPIEEFKIYNNKQKIGVANKDVIVRADQVEVGKWYVIRTQNQTDVKALDPDMVQFSHAIKPDRKATALDFTFSKTYNSLEDAQQDLSKQKVGRNYKISDKIYRLESDSNYRELTIEDLGTFSPILFPEEYVPTEEEKGKIPFVTSEYIEFHWNRLYGKSWRPEEYVDDGWKPEWMNDIKK